VGDALSELGRIYDSFAPKIYRYIFHRTGDRELAQDLTSEVFVRFLHARVEPANLNAFLYRIAHNLVADYFRRNLRSDELVEDVASELGDPVRFAELEMERSRLRRALKRLTPEQQQVVVLKFLEGLSNEEIARVLNKPVGAVKSLQHRALETLRSLLVAELPDRSLEKAGS
jgi:RNA polymerase sigma-70 factor (ECF subfamily)